MTDLTIGAVHDTATIDVSITSDHLSPSVLLNAACLAMDGAIKATTVNAGVLLIPESMTFPNLSGMDNPPLVRRMCGAPSTGAQPYLCERDEGHDKRHRYGGVSW